MPVTIDSNGGPQFLAGGSEAIDKFQFEKFCKEWGVQLILSSPHHHQSNGIAEEAVKEAKKIITATINPDTGKLDRSACPAGLVLFRNMPRKPTNLAPNKMIFGRIIRDNLPISRHLFKPEAKADVKCRLKDVIMLLPSIPTHLATSASRTMC